MTDSIQKQNLKSLLNTFDEILNATIERTWAEKDEQKHLQALYNGMEKIAFHLAELGEFSLLELENPEADPSDVLASFVIHFRWIEDAKSYLILWRDVIFQYQKALVLYRQEDVSIEDLLRLQEASEMSIQKGGQELRTALEQEITDLGKEPTELRKQLSTWKKQDTPWETYKIQLTEIRQQSQKLLEQNEKLQQVATDFFSIEETIEENLLACQKELQQYKDLATSTIEYINEYVEEKPKKVVQHLEGIEAKVESSYHLILTNNVIEKKTNKMLENLQTTVDTEGGLLLYREINFKKNTRQWLDSEVIPFIYEMWEIDQQTIISFKMALMNIRNRALLFSNEKKEEQTSPFNQQEFCFPLDSFLNKITTWEAELNRLQEIIQGRVAKDFQIREIYNTEKSFLPVPLQSTINQFRLEQNPTFVRFKKWVNAQFNAVREFKDAVVQEESLSFSEKIVRYIQHRKAPVNNKQYSSIFLTKGYIGKSFWVGRAQELQRFKKIVEQWKLGFRGAVILSGQRFSGKSLFGEYVSNQHFNQKSIRLFPNSVLKVEGRVFNTTFNLLEALEFVLKYSNTSHPMIWIDDLENWSGPNISLSQNVRNLCKVIDGHGNKMFFLVSMNNWVLTHLNKTHGIQKIFQAEINMDGMNKDEIKEAILIRHGATHKTLVKDEGTEPTAQEFQRMTSKIYRNTNGNIGESLSRWSHAIHRVSDDKVRYEPILGYSLPDFLNPDTALLLSTILMEKRTNEYRLRKLFGAPFKDKYQSMIQRLISVGLLTRHLDGWLEINELAVNEVAQLLDQEKYITFNR